MKLIPEQVSFLRKEIRRMERENKCELQGNLQAIEDNNYKIRDYDNLLRMCDYVMDIPIDEIGIGTKFALRFDDEDENEIGNYVLVDQKLTGNYLLQEAIDIESAIGKRVIGKKEGERIPGATIVKIYNDRRNHLSYLSEFEFSYDETKPLVITKSQKKLLDIEKGRKIRAIRLYELGLGAATERVAEIDEILKTAKIAEPIGDLIEVGSVFNITLFPEGEEITKTIQLIDRVVSNELENEYVVKNSAIGQAVLGLKNQAEFIVDIEGNKVPGIVFNISKDFIDIKEDKKAYQKRK